ncbi:pitrilysin family protein [Paucibacter sp. APW11]|uniref:Pitrilysin family protein n=1 Tax=Roseateles aquae TaxID=3077235 RepID=A0ABU3PBR3_9BURK|nr:pitrilysin family protein [Paucibacter sp. APW11]MDT9000000.1 pitrilysin family protein [Paucibacter sp. APW11]
MKLLRLSLAIALAFTATAHAHQLKAVNSVEGISEYRLPNGLQILLAPDASKPSTTVNVTYRVGSKHENYGETGMAHLLEHLIFKGSPRFQEPWNEFTKRGLRANGSTWFDRTNYFASFAANEDNLKWYLNWQADAMVHSYIARKHLDTEMTVVRNEMEMGENDAGGVTVQRTLAAMYQWHNYGKDTIGARADVENVDIARLQSFYRQHYQPDNATLIVSGKFDADKVLDWVEQSFGKLPRPKRVLGKLYTVDPVQDGERGVTVRRVGGTAQSLAAYHVPAGAHADYAAIEALNLILSDAPGGRLHKRLVEEKKLAASVGNFGLALAEPGFTMLSAELAPGASQEELNRELVAICEGFAERPVTAEELKRAQTRWLNRWESLYSNPEQVGVTLSEAIAQGDWRLFFLLRDRIKALTVEQVQRVATERFLPSNRTLSQYIPTDKPLRAPVPAFVDVATELKSFKAQASVGSVAAFDASPANIERQLRISQLANGMKLALLAKPSRGETVKGVLNLQLGDARGLFGQQSVAALMAALLDMGTQRLSREQLHDALDAAKLELQVQSTSADKLSIAFATKREHAATAIALIAEMLRSPRLEAASLDEVRTQALNALQAQRDDPQGQAGLALDQALSEHGRGDIRHARSFDEQEADLKAATLEQVRAFHARFYGAGQGQLAIVGDFDPIALQASVAAALGDWKATSAFERVPRQAVNKPGQLQLLRTPDKQNAMLLGALPMPISDEHPDRPALLLANHMLGGGGSSRLWMRIREKEGLSYGVGTGLNLGSQDPASAWVVYAIFAPQNRAKVEAALREEVARALTEGFSAKELAEAKQALLAQRRLNRAEDAGLSARVAGQLLLDRRFGREQLLDDALQQASLEQVNAALRKHFKLDGFQLFFAGDFK